MGACTVPARVVLLGANGFIGRNLRDAMGAGNIPHIALGRDEIDLQSPAASARLSDLIAPGDTVVFLSCVAPDRGNNSAFAANLRMADAVCTSAAARRMAHIVYFSSDAVYPFISSQVSENTPPAPPTDYGMMHYMREKKLGECGIPLAILRCTMVYGSGDTHNAYGPNRMWRQAALGEAIELFGNGEDTRDYVHVDDVIEITMAIVGRRSVGTLNIASGTAVSGRELADLIRDRFAPAPAVKHLPRRHAVTHRSFDTAALGEAFPGLVPAPIEAGLGRLARDLDS